MAKVVGFALIIVGAYLNATGVGAPIGTYFIYAGQAILVGNAYVEQRKAKRRARNAYNASLKDRIEMVDVTPDQARTIAMGRVRAVEGVRRKWVSGANSERLTMIVSFASHEIDGFEQFYFDDTLLSLDAQGYVQTAPYAKTTVLSDTVGGQLDALGNATVTLPVVPLAGSVSAGWWNGNIESSEGGVCTVSLNGLVVTVTDGPVDRPGQPTYVNYQYSVGASKARIRAYTGAAGQNVGAAIAADYPGKITSTDRFEGMAVAVVDIDFDPDVFPQGRPNVTAVFRGAKVLDPRTGITAFSENPALQAYHYDRHTNGWAVPAEEINTDDVNAAANVCDQSVSFTVRAVNGSTSTVTLPRYQCGIVIPTDGDPRASMDEIMTTMAGKWGWAGGVLRMRPGAMKTAVDTVTPDWIAQVLSEDGEPSGDAVVSITNGVSRDQRINRVTGTCVNPAERWQSLPFPAVQDPVLIAAKGVAAQEVEYHGVKDIAHAQHLGTIAIRESQASLRMQLQCNLYAWRAEIFDVLSLNLPRYGMTGKTAEVTGWNWSPTQGVTLRLSEITADIFTPVSELKGQDPAPNSDLPDPRIVEQITGLTVESGTVGLQDGSVLTRTRVSWDAVVSQSVISGGRIQVQYILAGPDLPEDWPLWEEAGGSTEAVIPALLTGRVYLFRARAVSAPPLNVRGPWSIQVAHQIAEAPPALQSTRVIIYRRSATVPALPSATSTYTFATGLISGLNNSWTVTVPSGSDPLYTSSVPVSGTSPTIDIPAGSWASPPVVLVQNGAAGPAGAGMSWVKVDASNLNAYNAGFQTLPTLTLANGTSVPGFTTTPGHTLVVVNPATSAIISGPSGFNTYLYSSGVSGLLAALAAVPDGAIAALFGWDATSCDAALRSALQGFGAGSTATWTSGRVSHAFIGARGLLRGQAYEATSIAATATGIVTLQAYYSASGLVTNGAVGNTGDSGAAGTPGTPGTQAAVVSLFHWGASQPDNPIGTSSFVWATAAHSAYSASDGWATAVPANPGTPGVRLWEARRQISALATATTTTGIAWGSGSGATIAAVSINGAAGTHVANATVYRWEPTIPLGPAGYATYTWAMGSFGDAPSGWFLTPGTSPSPGYTLWAASVQLTDSAVVAATPFDWTTASITARGYAGTPGTSGGPGQQGASARIAYARVTGFSLGSTPANVTTTGNTSFPPTNTWGGGETWGATVPTYTAGQSVHQTVGVYDPASGNTVWGVPYLSTLKVGSLSAITVNTGALTVTGDIRMQSGALLGGDFTGYGWPAAGGSGLYLGPSGLLLGNYNNGNYFQVEAGGNVFMPGYSVVNGVATASAVRIVSGALQGIGSGNGTAVANSAISIAANGALAGAGGGAVTIGGLGYSGDLNATRGAPAGTPVAGSFPNGAAATSVEGWAYSGAVAYNAVTDAATGLTTRLLNNARNVLAGGAGLAVGTLAWDSAGNRTSGYGVGVNARGIVGYDSSGNPTITINASDGSVAVRGDISGSTGSFVGSVSVGGANYGNSATGFYAGVDSGVARFRVGNSTQYIRWTGSGWEIELGGISASITGTLNTAVANGPQVYGTLYVNATGGRGPYIYSWDAPTVITDNDNYPSSYYLTGSLSDTAVGVAGSATNNVMSAQIRCFVRDANGTQGFVYFSHYVTHGTVA